MTTNKPKITLWFRRKVTVNTDPQRRCYDGHNYSERTDWSPWSLVGPYASTEDADSSAKTFKELNPDRQYKVCLEML